MEYLRKSTEYPSLSNQARAACSMVDSVILKSVINQFFLVTIKIKIKITLKIRKCKRKLNMQCYAELLATFLISFTRLSKVADKIILRHDEMAKRVSNR